MENGRLPIDSRKVEYRLDRALHPVRTCWANPGKPRMYTDARPELLRLGAAVHEALQIVTKLLLRDGHKLVLCSRIIGHPDARQQFIAFAVTKPAPHLH
ncbi:hypothetical protein D3C84_869600 [compost metagenome]